MPPLNSEKTSISLPGRNLAGYATHGRCPNRMAFPEFIMNTKSFAIRRSLLVMNAGFVLFAFGDRSLSQDAVQREIELRQIQTERPMLPPETEFFPDQHSPDNPGIVRPNLNPLLRPPPAGGPSAGAPGFDPSNRPELHPGQLPKIHQSDAQGPDGPFAEDRRRIAALTESAERIAQAGLPDVAQGLRERAGQLERELAEKQERMQQEERQRTESAMPERQEQRRAGIERGDDPTPPLRELHEQMEQVRRDMHKLSEQMADLTRLIQQHHNPRTDRGRHEEMDEDGDDEDGDDDEMDDDEASDD